jgi:hypothetical protein
VDVSFFRGGHELLVLEAKRLRQDRRRHARQLLGADDQGVEPRVVQGLHHRRGFFTIGVGQPQFRRPEVDLHARFVRWQPQVQSRLIEVHFSVWWIGHDPVVTGHAGPPSWW